MRIETESLFEAPSRRPGWLGKVRRWLKPDKAPMQLPPAQLARPRDSLAVGIDLQGSFTPDAWCQRAMRGALVKGEDKRLVRLATGDALTAQLQAEFSEGWRLIEVLPPEGRDLPTVSGTTRAYVSLRPEKLILSEDLILTFTNAERGSVTVAASVEDAADLVLFSAFIGSRNCLPMAPSQATGLSGRSLSARAVGQGLSWPTINPGIDVCVSVAVKSTVLYRVEAPKGYAPEDLSQIQIAAHLDMFGAALQ